MQFAGLPHEYLREEGSDLQGFLPSQEHQFMVDVYGDNLHHNNGTHLDRGVADDALWQRRWWRLTDQSARWYATSPWYVRRRFTARLDAEYRGVCKRRWNSEQTLVFAHVILMNTPGARQAKDIRAMISWRMDLWEEGQHAGLVGDTEAEGAAREGKVDREEVDEEGWVRQLHDTILSGNLRQSVWQLTAREGGGCLLLGEVCTNNGRPKSDFLREKHPDTRIPQVGDPQCSAFERYEEVPETVPLEFLEDDVTWAALNLSSAARAPGAEALELKNWLLRFGCASEELRVEVVGLEYWLENSSPSWTA